MRRVSVFGATGSVGESTLDLLVRREDVSVAVLTGGRNVARLAEQAVAHRAELVVTAFDEEDDAIAAANAACSPTACAQRWRGRRCWRGSRGWAAAR